MTRVDWIDEWSHVRRLLCVRLDSLGGVLMTTPALAAARSGLGTCGRLSLLASQSGAALGELLHEVDEAIECQGCWLRALPPRIDAIDRGMVEKLRAHRFDGAMIFTEYGESPLPAALMCRLAGIPLRLAYSRQNPEGLLTHWVPERESDHLLRHEVRRQLDLAGEVGWHVANERLRLCTHTAAMVRMQNVLQCGGIDPRRPWIVVSPGAGSPARRYPEELFVQVVARLSGQLGLQLVFSGSENDMELVERIHETLHEPGVSLAGRLSMPELAALINLAPLVLTNNAGPAQLAAALCTPLVVLYALTNPQQTPWHAPSRVLFHDVPCRYCYSRECREPDHPCLSGIDPDEVVAAVDDMLSVASWPITSTLPTGELGEVRLSASQD